MWSPIEYAKTAVLAKAVGEELLSRCDWMTIQPSTIVDLGCGTGEVSALLKSRYPKANVIALDSADHMLKYAEQQASLDQFICSDAGTLPFQDQSVDLLFANFLLPWYPQFESAFTEWRRVLKPNGLLMLSALGPATLHEYAGLVPEAHLPYRLDMHDLGDLLLAAGFADPVLDASDFTMVYRDHDQLLAELTGSGMLAIAADQPALPPLSNETWEVTFEVIFAHAFQPVASETVTATGEGVAHFPLSQLRKQLSGKKESN